MSAHPILLLGALRVLAVAPRRDLIHDRTVGNFHGVPLSARR